jgi:selenocysteine lyase
MNVLTERECVTQFHFQPISEIGSSLRTLNTSRRTSGLFPILYHTDAAQAVSKIIVNVDELGVDYLTIAGHKVLEHEE